MSCKYLSKALNGKIKCKYYKRYIDYNVDCKNCLNRNFVRNKPIKKVSKKRITVTQDTYNKVMQRDNCRCRLCGTSLNLQLHHIIYRSEDKSKINDENNLIMLCAEHHRLVHSNKHYWQPKLLEMNKGENKNGKL